MSDLKVLNGQKNEHLDFLQTDIVISIFLGSYFFKAFCAGANLYGVSNLHDMVYYYSEPEFVLLTSRKEALDYINSVINLQKDFSENQDFTDFLFVQSDDEIREFFHEVQTIFRNFIAIVGCCRNAELLNDFNTLSNKIFDMLKKKGNLDCLYDALFYTLNKPETLHTIMTNTFA